MDASRFPDARGAVTKKTRRVVLRFIQKKPVDDLQRNKRRLSTGVKRGSVAVKSLWFEDLRPIGAS
jgi:hypothetical protein